MGILSTIAGKNGCGSSDASTGKQGCQIPFGTPLHLIRMPRGMVIPKSTDFNLTYINEQIQAGKFTPLMGATAFERLSTEDGMSTTSSGVENLNLKGLPKYRLSYQEGHEFYRQIDKVTGYNNSDFLIGDDLGNIKIAINSNGDFVGFTAGQVLAEMTIEKVQGGDAEMKPITVQFTNRPQWDRNYTIITSEQLGFDLYEIKGSNPVTLSFVSVPADGDTELELKVVLASDRDTFVSGTSQDNYQVLVDGNANDGSGLTEDPVNKTVTITGLTALSSDEEIEVRFYDSSDSYSKILLGGLIYDSNKLKETVV